ncbi:MAG: alpha/beta fold hydrolase, partial [Gemmatimonadaceae bacterium]
MQSSRPRTNAAGRHWRTIARSARGLGGIGYANPLKPTDETIEMYFAPIVSSPKRKAQYDALTLGLGTNSLADSAPALAKYRGPVRILWGADDVVFATSSPDWLAHTFPNSRGVRLLEHAKLSSRKNSRTSSRRKHDGC